MNKLIAIILASLALTVAAGVAAHDNPLDPGHKHGLEIDRSKGYEGLTCTSDGNVIVHFKESVGVCAGGWKNVECRYTCLYQVWANWRGADGYQGTDTEPRGGNYKCHIANSHDPTRARATFRAPKPHWAKKQWGVYVRDGWGLAQCRFN